MKLYSLILGIVVTTSLPISTTFFYTLHQSVAQAEQVTDKAAEAYAVIDWVARGCHGTRHSRFEYIPAPSPRIVVTDFAFVFKKDSTTNRWREIQTAHPLGTVTLSPEQVTRFKNLLISLRTRHLTDCMTKDIVTVLIHTSGKQERIDTEQDISCGGQVAADAQMRDLADLNLHRLATLSLPRLLDTARLSAQKKVPLPYVDPARRDTNAYNAVLRKHAVGKNPKET